MRALAHAKLNLALVVGPTLPNGKHELTTVFQRLALADTLELVPHVGETVVDGFAEDTLVTGALALLGEASGVPQRYRVGLEKRIPVAAGLGGGSADAAAALRLANSALPRPLPAAELAALASELGADVPFFLTEGPQLGEGDGSLLSPLPGLPQAFHVLLLSPHGAVKESTGAVYRAFDARHGEEGYTARRALLLATLAAAAAPGDLAVLPGNDLASSPLAPALLAAGAFRADVSGAGPAVYALFERAQDAHAAAAVFAPLATTLVTAAVL